MSVVEKIKKVNFPVEVQREPRCLKNSASSLLVFKSSPFLERVLNQLGGEVKCSDHRANSNLYKVQFKNEKEQEAFEIFFIFLILSGEW